MDDDPNSYVPATLAWTTKATIKHPSGFYMQEPGYPPPCMPHSFYTQRKPHTPPCYYSEPNGVYQTFFADGKPKI